MLSSQLWKAYSCTPGAQTATFPNKMQGLGQWHEKLIMNLEYPYKKSTN